MLLFVLTTRWPVRCPLFFVLSAVALMFVPSFLFLAGWIYFSVFNLSNISRVLCCVILCLAALVSSYSVFCLSNILSVVVLPVSSLSDILSFCLYSVSPISCCSGSCLRLSSILKRNNFFLFFCNHIRPDMSSHITCVWYGSYQCQFHSCV